MSRALTLLSGLRSSTLFCLLISAQPAASAGWSFDTAVSPEKARDWVAVDGCPDAPPGSWLRIRGLEHSAVYDAAGVEVASWAGMPPPNSIAGRRAALSALRTRGYRLVAMIGWSGDSWKNGQRPGQPLRRLPLDLREAAERCRLLGKTYGDLIDYWEIWGEPDISFVEENPETYAALMKACALGFRDASVQSSQRNGVLNGAFALAPGPYFDVWIANDGLRYVDGFNYHYYGYAEDLTGVHRQFEAAVTRPRPPTPAGESVFTTQFYPDSEGWVSREVFRFDSREGPDSSARNGLQTRPLGTHEPHLEAQGRWLVSAGTTVRETIEGWEFTVTRPAGGPLRPAMAELPLPVSWKTEDGASWSFQYRASAPPENEASTAPSVEPSQPEQPGGLPTLAPAIVYADLPPLAASPAAGAPIRKLPVFLTEYGYGLMDGDAAKTKAGRMAQRTWFESAGRQIRGLGIGAAMGFVLPPYFEAGRQEFGLSMSVEAPDPADPMSPSPKIVRPTLGNYQLSPALTYLLQEGTKPIEPRDWPVASTPPSPVVIDFVADQTLLTDKTKAGYRLRTSAAGGECILYNFAAFELTGQVELTGPWTFANGDKVQEITLAPAARERLPVAVRLEPSQLYVAQVATARFRLRTEHPPRTARTAIAEPIKKSGAAEVAPRVGIAPVQNFLPPSPTFVGAGFDAYIRTRNGNLYQTWPRLIARETWQWYVEPFAAFTPAFFGRAHLPPALADNEPAAIAFFFRPAQYPVVYQVRRASIVTFERQTSPRHGAKKQD